MNIISCNSIKVVLAILFFLCIANMPYGCYQFVRFIALIVFIILAYHANEQKKKSETIIYIFLALLFQPFFKVALGRTFWNVLNLLIGIGLLLSVSAYKSTKKK